MAGYGKNGKKLLEWLDMTGNYLTLLEMARNCWIAGNGWIWLDMAGKG